MKINKQQLQTALEIVKPGLANKELIEQSTSFAFMNGKVVTFNDEISISHPVEGLDLKGAIKAEELYQLLSKMKKDEIIVHKKKNEVILEVDKSKAGFTLQQEIKLPLDEVGEQDNWNDLPEDFIPAMRFTVEACSEDVSRPVLTCVHVNNKGFAEGSDGYRISHYKMKGSLMFNTTLIPADAVREIIRLEPTKVAEGEGWIHFSTDEGAVLSCRVFEGEYPDTTPFLSIEEGQEMKFPENASEIVDRVFIFAKREIQLDESIRIEFGNNEVVFTSQSDYGWAEEKEKVEFEDEPISFSITPYLLQDILKETNVFVISKKRQLLKFEGDNWYYITRTRENKI